MTKITRIISSTVVTDVDTEESQAATLSSPPKNCHTASSSINSRRTASLNQILTFERESKDNRNNLLTSTTTTVKAENYHLTANPNQKALLSAAPHKLRFQFVEILRDTDRNQLNPFLYCIRFSFAGSEWKVLHTYNEVAMFFEKMAIIHTKNIIPRLTRSLIDDTSSPNVTTSSNNNISPWLVKPVLYLSDEEAYRRVTWFNVGLDNILSDEVLRNTKECMRFIEVSPCSFHPRLGKKYSECLVKRRTGGYRGGCSMLRAWFQWKNCWLVVKPSFLAYLDPSNYDIRAVILVDSDFDVRQKLESKHKVISIRNMSRCLTVRTKSRLKLDQLYKDIHKVQTESPFANLHRFSSFAPIRISNAVKWIVDGSLYFKAVAELIDMARKQIFITGWFLSPELHLKRPPIDNRYRLDRLLRKKAESGVDVYILLYKEVMSFVGNNSAYSKKKLNQIHPNIKVLRFPDHVKPNPILLWTNHEKSVIVDQTYALVGGIDLCYGRWDDCDHRLSDLGDSPVSHENIKTFPSSLQKKKRNPGNSTQDLFRQSTEDFIRQSCPDYTESTKLSDYPHLLQRHSSSTFHREISLTDGICCDVNHPAVCGPSSTLQRCVSLESGIDMSKCDKHLNLIEMCIGSLPHWSSPIPTSIHLRLKEKMLLIPKLFRGPCIDYNDSATTSREPLFTRAVASHKWRLWIGKDYSNVVIKDFCDVDQPFTELIDRTQCPRMPWHDVAVSLVGQAANDVARHFIQRWNYAKQVKQKQNKSYSLLLPESPLSRVYRTVEMFNCDIQVLRSVGLWSSGQHRTEHSIYSAYLDAIKNAEHYIYIENQFFISKTEHSTTVRNRISQAIFNRIKEAISKDEDFFVYIVIPLMPAFEGAYDSSSGVANQTITHWNYQTISHGAQSLIAQLCCLNCNPFKYISFCALRNWGRIKSQLVTEMVYVHSKVMIVDDHLVLLGSANINDRSMLGSRDSELAVFIEDREFCLSKLRSKTRQVGKFASSLRIRLMREHLGDLNEKPQHLYDPASSWFFEKVWQHTAAKNTMIFDKVFTCVPKDHVTSFEDLRRLKQHGTSLAKSNVQLANELLRQLDGYLVLVPLKFLHRENLLPGMWKKESFVPSHFWT